MTQLSSKQMVQDSLTILKTMQLEEQASKTQVQVEVPSKEKVQVRSHKMVKTNTISI